MASAQASIFKTGRVQRLNQTFNDDYPKQKDDSQLMSNLSSFAAFHDIYCRKLYLVCFHVAAISDKIQWQRHR